MNISNRHNEAIEFLALIAKGRTSLREVAGQRRVSITYLGVSLENRNYCTLSLFFEQNYL